MGRVGTRTFILVLYLFGSIEIKRSLVPRGIRIAITMIMMIIIIIPRSELINACNLRAYE